jgi:hypothetical protein
MIVTPDGICRYEEVWRQRDTCASVIIAASHFADVRTFQIQGINAE